MRRHGRLHQIDLARPGLLGGIPDGPPLDLGDARGGDDHEARLHETPAPAGLVDEVAEHLLGAVEVGDDAVAKGPDDLDRARRPPEHRLGVVADRLHGPVHVHRHDRRLVEDHALAPDIEPGIGRPQVHRQVAREHLAQPAQVHSMVALPPNLPRSSKTGPRSGPAKSTCSRTLGSPG
jgi:hypothetical protein